MDQEQTLPILEQPWGRLALKVLFEDWFRLRARGRRGRLTPLEGIHLRQIEDALQELDIDAATLKRLSDRQTSEADRPSSRETTPSSSADRSSVAHPVV